MPDTILPLLTPGNMLDFPDFLDSGMKAELSNKLGGISLISDFLTGLMGPKTATPILAATSGILSWVSSTTGVVMPALFPICSEVVTKFTPSVNYMELIAAVTATSVAMISWSCTTP